MKELEDNEWFPARLRQFQTDYIGFVVSRFQIYWPLVENLKKKQHLPDTMFDLCSGSGEPAISIFRSCGRFQQLLLSDKFPVEIDTNDPRIRYPDKPLDAGLVTFEPGYYYTMFNAFHHFNDKDKQKLLTQMVENGSSGCFAEILSPTLFSALKVLFATTIGTLLLTPFIRPFKLSRIFFTYIVPINLLTITIDGIISVCKSRSVHQCKALFAHLGEKVNVFSLQQGFRSLIVIQVNS